MTNKQFDNELAYLIVSFNEFIRIFYKVYKPYVKIIALILLSYAAYALGRLSIIDKVEQSVNNLKKLLDNRVKYTIQLPAKKQTIKKARRIILGIIIVFSFLLIAKYYKIKPLKVFSLKFFIFALLITLFLLISAIITEKILDYFIQKGRMIDLTKNEQLYQLQKELGPKVQNLLKIFICKNLFINYKEPSKHICYKQKCKQHRNLLRERFVLIQNLVLSAFNFYWCSICTKQSPFEQYVAFINNEFLQQAGLTQSEEVSLRNDYLYDEIQRMVAWVRQLAPCNCSQIYWREEITKIKTYKTQQKALQNELLMIQYKK